MTFTVPGECNCSACKDMRRVGIRPMPVACEPSEPIPTGSEKRFILNPQDVRDFHDNPMQRIRDEIGSGAYGTVFSHEDPNLVVKKFSVYDGYPVWVSYAALAYRSGRGNSVLPRIYGMSMPLLPDDSDSGYVLMERLSKTLNRVDEQEDTYNYKRLSTAVSLGANNVMSRVAEDGIIVRPGFEEITGGFAHLRGERLNRRMFDTCMLHMSLVASEIVSYGVKLSTDMHQGNFMLRANNDLVITDPFVLQYRGYDEGSAGNKRKGVAVTKALARKAAAFQPGFYSEYEERRVVNII